MKIKQTLSHGMDTMRTYWNRPPKGRYMSVKEIMSLSMGGMGVKFVVTCVQAIMLGIGNTFIGNTIGIPPLTSGLLYAVSVILSFPLGALRSNMIDRSRFKKGKYRPYIVYMGIPTAILSIAYVFMPYEAMNQFWDCAVVLLFNIAFQFFFMFYMDVYESIPNVLSSNTMERSDVCAIRSPIVSFAPTIMNAFMPTVAKMVTGTDGNMYDLAVFRAFYPPCIIIGFVLSLLIYYKTEERVVQAHTHVIKVKLSDAFRAVSKNKYFWIIAVASATSVLEAAYATILAWLYNYQTACTAGEYTLVTLINGNAALWPMLFAPFFIRLFGKRNLLIVSNMLNIIFIFIMFPIMKYANMDYMIWIMLMCSFVNGMITTLGNTLGPSIQGDIRDYQQYISGERIDGMFVYLQIIANFATMIFGFVMLSLQENAGLNVDTAIMLGYSGNNVYEVLYNTEYFRSICTLLVGISLVGALVNTVPYFFYDMTESKQRAMVAVLKLRALFEDYGNDALSDEKLVEAIDVIRDSYDNYENTPVPVKRDAIKEARKNKRMAMKKSEEAFAASKAELKRARKEYVAAKEFNQVIEISKCVVKEINKFELDHIQKEVAFAEEIVEAGLAKFDEVPFMSVKDARALPHETEEQKEYRDYAITLSKNLEISRDVVGKYYPSGLVEFDLSRIDSVVERLNECENELAKVYAEQSEMKKDGSFSEYDKETLKQIKNTRKAMLKKLKQMRQSLSKEEKKLTIEYSNYIRAARPYIEANTLLKQKENYSHYEEIAERYEESKLRAEEELAAKIAKEEEEKAEKKAAIERMKAEKLAKKEAKKEQKDNAETKNGTSIRQRLSKKTKDDVTNKDSEDSSDEE